jgi:hypothetical protein
LIREATLNCKDDTVGWPRRTTPEKTRVKCRLLASIAPVLVKAKVRLNGFPTLNVEGAVVHVALR